MFFILFLLLLLMVFFEFAALLIFIFILSKSSSLVVDNASKLSLFFGISELAVGLILISVLTSLPELSVSVASGVAKESSIAAGNVFGSVIFNVLFILGLSAFLFGFKVSKDKLEDIVLVLTLSTILSVYFLFQSLVSGTGIGFAEGVLLILIFIWYVNRIYTKNKSKRIHPSPSISRQEGLNAFILFILGIFAVLISSHFVVEFAKILAEKANLATSFIGATIIAMGTSLPEISVVFQAIKKKKYDIGIGNIFGANTVNLTLVLGVASTLTPITVNIVIFSAALLFAIITNSFFLYFSVLKREFTKKTGIFMLLIYLIYLFVIFSLQFSTAQTISFT